MSTQFLHQGGLRPATPQHPGLQVHSIAAPETDKRLSFLMSAALYSLIAGGAVLLAHVAPTLIEKTPEVIGHVLLYEPPKPVEAHLSAVQPAPTGPKGDNVRPANVEPIVAPLPTAIPEATPSILSNTDLSHAGLFDPALPTGIGLAGSKVGLGTTPSVTNGLDPRIGLGSVVDVDVTAVHILQQVQPIYPPLARLSHKEGDVVLLMTIDEHGIPILVQMESGEPIFKGEALRAARGWRFTPASVSGQPHAARFRLNLQFRLR